VGAKTAESKTASFSQQLETGDRVPRRVMMFTTPLIASTVKGALRTAKHLDPLDTRCRKLGEIEVSPKIIDLNSIHQHLVEIRFTSRMKSPVLAHAVRSGSPGRRGIAHDIHKARLPPSLDLPRSSTETAEGVRSVADHHDAVTTTSSEMPPWFNFHQHFLAEFSLARLISS